MVRWCMPPTDLVLTADERAALERLSRSRRDRMDLVTRARGILMLADGATYLDVHQRLGWSSRTTAMWKTRFLRDRLAGLRGRHRGSKPTTLTPALEARILTKTREAPPDGSTHWSSRKLATVLQTSHSIVALAWRRAGLQPHRRERYVRS